MSRIKKSVAVASVCAGLVGGFEGVRQTAYADPATRGKPWTICFGETEGVKPGDYRSLAQCKAGLIEGLDRYANGMEACIYRPLPDARFVGFISLTWNIGVKGFCRSSVARLYNEGRTQEACDAMLKFNRAAGIVFPGLTLRRKREREWCLQETI